eukprot:6188960-Pleurochrysis_carterae.AAC.2
MEYSRRYLVKTSKPLTEEEKEHLSAVRAHAPHALCFRLTHPISCLREVFTLMPTLHACA